MREKRAGLASALAAEGGEKSAPHASADDMIASFQSQARRAPRAPGVYVMKDGDGRVIYVGKSVHIRQRLLQHADSIRSGFSDRNYRWIWHVRSLSWYETGSELYALLLEDQLIKQHWPVGNVRQKEYLEYAWLAFSKEWIPRLQVIDARQRGQYPTVFGPFHDRYHARDMADLVQERFRLRTCAAVRDGGCLQGEIRRCLGPCRTPEAAARYRRTMDRAAVSLRVLDPFFLRFIHQLIKKHSRNREFEKAARYHAMLHRYQALIQRQGFLANFQRHGLVIREHGRWENRFCFLQGKLVWCQGGGLPNPALLEEAPMDEWQIIDRAHVIWQWLHRRGGNSGAAIIDARFFREGIFPV